VLVYTTGTFGFWLNKQVSTEHVMRLLAWDKLFSGMPESLALLIGVPIFILLFGNLYCGYLCPFGAIQELVSLLVPRRFKPRLSHTTVQGARFIKYAVLFALVISVFALENENGLLIDPLTSVFNRQLWPEFLLTPLWLFLGVGILFVTRFWCRYLCPTGAFLSLLNRCAWLQRLLPAKKYGRCEFGLAGRDHLDCIYCDRCNIQNALIPAQKEAITKETPNLVSRFFLIWLLITASLLIWPLLPRGADVSDPTPPSADVQSK
ncbi:MAG: 4Fe-4S binding protein, partial [Planctomycetes bacterium]|nr:4Fe-4S binding protein [Planctomycetota bacterium]